MSFHLDYPLTFDGRGQTQSTRDDEHVRNLIEQILFTVPGERVNRPDFGSGVLQLVFAPNSPELAATTQFLVQSALQQWLGDLVRLEAVEVSAEDSTLSVVIRYVLVATDERKTDVFTRGIG